jgi:GNAT superfamily N-acetyltransferase
MAITFQPAASDQQFEQILQLQQRNLARALDAGELRRHGFVYAEHSKALLQRMAAELPQMVALSDGLVIGYNLAMSADMHDALPSLAPMFAQFELCMFRGQPLARYRYLVGGQVCVDRAYRGHGLMRRLYDETRQRAGPGYRLCVTEVSARNPVSLQAHLNIGFEVLAGYHDGKESWRVVGWDFETANRD